MGNSTTSTHIFTFSTGHFSAGPPMIGNRAGHAQGTLPDGRVLVADGFNTASTTVSTVELFNGPACATPTPSCEGLNAPCQTPTATATPVLSPTPTLTPQPTPTPSEPPCEVVDSQPACNSTVSTEVTDFVVYVSYFINGSVPASAFTVNGIPADDASTLSGSIIFHFNASPMVRGENSMHIPPDAFSCTNGRGVEEFMCTFTYQPPRSTPIPRPRPTRAPRP